MMHGRRQVMIGLALAALLSGCSTSCPPPVRAEIPPQLTALPLWPDTRQLEDAQTETAYRKALEDYIAALAGDYASLRAQVEALRE